MCLISQLMSLGVRPANNLPKVMEMAGAGINIQLRFKTCSLSMCVSISFLFFFLFLDIWIFHFQGSILILIFKERIFKTRLRLVMEFQVSVSCWRVVILKAYHIGNQLLQGVKNYRTCIKVSFFFVDFAAFT